MNKGQFKTKDSKQPTQVINNKIYKDYYHIICMRYKINWWCLPPTTRVFIKKLPKTIKHSKEYITVRKLLNYTGKDDKINKQIQYVKKGISSEKSIKINFPIMLNCEDYVKLYALMISEGSTKTEFSLNVPEEFFHNLFRQTLSKLISKEIINNIRIDFNNNFKRSRAPILLRHIIPFPKNIPNFIINNKNFAKTYLKIAFEAEGSPIIIGNKRWIKLSRNGDITNLINKEKFPLQKRIYKNEIKKLYPLLYNLIIKNPPSLLKDESYMLEKLFGIQNKINFECIRKNKTNFRCGKISARWTLYIHSINIKKFINNINFISKPKKQKTKRMLKFRYNSPKYSTLKVIKKISDEKDVFNRKDFVKKMKSLNYKSPPCYLYRYERKGLIKKIGRGVFKLTNI